MSLTANTRRKDNGGWRAEEWSQLSGYRPCMAQPINCHNYASHQGCYSPAESPQPLSRNSCGCPPKSPPLQSTVLGSSLSFLLFV